MSKFKDLLKTCKQFAEKRSPEICIGLGIVGMVSAVIFTGRATIKAKEAVEAKKEELKVEELTTKEVVQTTWKYYIPTAISMVGAVTLIIMADRVHNKRNAALAAAYSGIETTLSTYKDKIKEVVGEKKAKEVEGAVAQDQIDKAPSPADREVFKVYPKYAGVHRYYDPFGHMFYTDRNKMDALEDRLNLRLNDEVYISCNEYYDELGLNVHSIMYDILGWYQCDKNGHKIEIKFSYMPTTDQDGEACTVMSFITPPKQDYKEIY